MKNTYKPTEAHKLAREGKWRQAMVASENSKTAVMDWLGLEQSLIAYIQETQNHDLDELLAAFTKRGIVLDPYEHDSIHGKKVNE